MTNEARGPLTAEEKHEQARAFALSGSLSKFQQAKQRKALENKLLAKKSNLPVKASRPSVKNPRPSSSSYSSGITTTTVTKQDAPAISTAPPPLVAPPSLASSSTIISAAEGDVSLPSLLEPPPEEVSADGAATAATTTPVLDADEHPKTEWATVECQDWQYVYICDGPFEGRFGYYDDHQHGSALIYFGMPMVGDGPYSMRLEDLRKPPPKYCENAFTAM